MGICVKHPNEVGILGWKVGGTLKTGGSQLNMAAGIISIERIFLRDTVYSPLGIHRTLFSQKILIGIVIKIPVAVTTYLSARSAI